MRFGLFLLWQHPPEADPRRVRDELLEQLRFVRDELDSVFAGQHFLSQPWQMAQTVPWLARIAADSAEMRVGAGVMLTSLLNPVEVAEEVATLDAISGGRFVLGVGLGYRDVENEAFDLPERRARAFIDKLDVVTRLLEGQSVTAEGPGYRLEDARIGIRPVQSPRPPIWMAANADSAVRRAARHADTWLVNPHASLSELERQCGLFLEARGSAPDELPAIRELCIRPTDEEAVEVARPYLDRKYRSYVAWGQSEVLPPSDTLRREWDELRHDRFILGSPETVVAQIKEHEERLGITELVARVQWPGLPNADALRTLELLVSEVIPHFSRRREGVVR
jgi:alkanesulfonate monooxygenase SsuD/methylene tetrahydromethanopterin reductase-like flavin-dependent oxidoreductase (luciferase family)